MSDTKNLFENIKSTLCPELVEKILEYKKPCSVCHKISFNLTTIHKTKKAEHSYCDDCVSMYERDMIYFDTNRFVCYVKNCNKVCYGYI